MRRATPDDAATVARIINDPTVRPHVGPGDEDFDPSELIADKKNILLFDEGGGQFFHWKGPGIYEAHSFYLVRGNAALTRGREAVRCMFEEFGAEKIWRATPLKNRPARWFNRQLGFRSCGEVSLPYYGDCELFELKGTTCP